MGYISRLEVQVVRERMLTDLTRYSTPQDIANCDIAQKHLHYADREKFLCLHLDVKNHIVNYEVVSIGALSTSLVHPREVFKGALLANAANIICLHNHPSGDPMPSQEDIAITRRLREAGNILGIELLDHIIIAGDTHHSMLENNEL